MPTLHGTVTWPGLISPASGSYTCSHGISPSMGIVRGNWQGVAPGLIGDLTFSDAINKAVIPGCKLERQIIGVAERTVTIQVQDRRWKWGFGAISGCYNMLDPHGKLILWSVRSPTELAELCLQAAGETNFFVDMPDGLSSADAAKLMPTTVNGFLPPGVNLPITGTNPLINWIDIPPMHALDALANQFGRRVVYNPLLDRVYVVRIGDGKTMPGDGSIAADTPSVSELPRPDFIAVAGVPTRFQGRFLLIAVGEEWDGSIKPINALSYAPKTPATKQITKITVNPPPAGGSGDKWTITIDGVSFDYVIPPGFDAFSIATAFAALINASYAVTGLHLFTVNVVNGTITITFNDEKTHNVTSSIDGTHGGGLTVENTQAAAPGKPTWQFSWPPTLGGSSGALNAKDIWNLPYYIQATDRLTADQAVALAQKSVWKWYQLADVDVSGKGAILVPGYGRVVRKQQIILEAEQVDQIIPEAADRKFVDRAGHPLIVNIYNGYSRDKPAQCYGSIHRDADGAWYINDSKDENFNTPENTLIHVDFSIDPVYQLVKFSSPVYMVSAGTIIEPNPLILQTACTVRDAVTNAFVRYVAGGPRGGIELGSGVQVTTKQDVQLNVTSKYDSGDGVTLLKTTILEQDPIVRAKAYLAGIEADFSATGGTTRRFNGIRTIGPDGAIQQVTWEVGDDGVYTTVSLNVEHSVYIPQYSARRRIEALQPVMYDKLADGSLVPRVDATGKAAI